MESLEAPPPSGWDGTGFTPQFDTFSAQPEGGSWQYCDLCDFKVWHDEPLVLLWAIRSHMYERHPSKGARVWQRSLRRRP